MFQWLSNRMGRSPQPALERVPVTNHVVGITGMSPRRGVTLRPFEVVKFENRRRTRVARASRKANR